MRSTCDRDTRQRPTHLMRPGLTGTEVLVLIFALGLLWAASAVLAVLADERQTSIRLGCGMHLSNLGKAMWLYSRDYGDALPRAGSPTSVYGPVAWNAPNRQSAYGLDANGAGGTTSVSSSLYLLVRYAYLTPESLICPVEKGVRKWTGERVNDVTPKLADCWDFGSDPQIHCSYAYHWPFGPKPLATSSDPGFAVAADRNPWLPAPRLKAKSFPKSPDGQRTFQGKSGSFMDQAYGNSAVHPEGRQNVLFLDGHVAFEKRVFCSLEDDNIYTRSAFPDKGDPLGVPPVFSVPMPESPNRKDSVLVHDPPTWPAGAGR